MKIGSKFRKVVMGSLATFTVMGTSMAAVAVLGVGPAGANAANPQPGTVGVWTPGANGSVNVSLSGTWTWAGQACSGRYGEGWAVDWWGLSSTSTPNPNFTLTNASGVSTTGSGGSMTSANTTGNTIAGSAGSLGVPKGSTSSFFHVGTVYDGETINSVAGACTDSGSGGNVTSSGTWSAMATYPSAADIPPSICVNFYDEHGSSGKISGSANDFSPTNDGDNSIDTNAFDPSGGSCFTWTPGHITGDIYLCSSGSQTTTEVLGGTLSATGNTAVGSTSNPLGSTLVVPGSYDMSGTAPSGYEFVTCGGDSTVNSSSSCSDAVLVPPNGTGHGVCYVQLIPSPPTPPTAPSGGTTPATPAATPVVAATTVHTGEPWAGSRPWLLGMLGFGSVLFGFGLVQRRRVRCTEKA